MKSLNNPRFTARERLLLALAVVFCAFCIRPVAAQTTTTYSNTTTGAINSSTTCTAPLVRNFTVGTSYVVGDVDLGVLASHTYRGDIRLTLQSPAGTRVQLVNGDANTISGDNFNVRLNDGASQAVNTDNASGNHATTAPPYQNTFSPNAALSAFNGQNAAGTWRLEICDIYTSADNGTFTRADLYITSVASNQADLSLAQVASTTSPGAGSNVTLTLTAASASGSAVTATGVQVRSLLGPGLTFVSASGTGTYNSTTGIWSVGSLAPGANASIAIVATVNATSGASLSNMAEIIASSHADPDSTVNNGATTEDDYAAVTLTVSGTRSAGVAPALICPRTTLLFNWDTVSWTAGSVNNSYALSGLGTVQFAITNPATWSSNATYGGQSPTRTNVVTGGYTPAQYGIMQYIDFVTRDQVATTTITLPATVAGAQFRIFDVDYNASQFADRVKVTGSRAGVTVLPVLTNGASNYVIGNEAFGDVLSADNSANGNITITFSQPIDTIVIEYGNHSLSPANPGGQAVVLHDISICAPDATLDVTKASTVLSDPINGTTNPVHIPGAILRYCISMTNTGTATASSITATDPIPAGMALVAGSIRSGASCAAATTVEDDNATGTDESDPAGASVAGSVGAQVLTITSSSLAAGSTLAVTYQTTVQ